MKTGGFHHFNVYTLFTVIWKTNVNMFRLFLSCFKLKLVVLPCSFHVLNSRLFPPPCYFYILNRNVIFLPCSFHVLKQTVDSSTLFLSRFKQKVDSSALFLSCFKQRVDSFIPLLLYFEQKVDSSTNPWADSCPESNIQQSLHSQWKTYWWHWNLGLSKYVAFTKVVSETVSFSVLSWEHMPFIFYFIFHFNPSVFGSCFRTPAVILFLIFIGNIIISKFV